MPADRRHRRRRDLPGLLDHRLLRRDPACEVPRGRRDRGRDARRGPVLGADGEPRERDDRRRALGRRDRREARLRELHAQGDPRAAARRRRDDRAQPARRRARPRARRRPRPGRRAARRHRRLRDGLPRRPGRGLPDRGVGGPALRRRGRERMALPPAADRGGHARRRDLAVGRDRRHARRPASGAPVRRTDAGDHELAGVADHARGRRRPATPTPGSRSASQRPRRSRPSSR